MFDWVLNTSLVETAERGNVLKAIEKTSSPMQLAFGIMKNLRGSELFLNFNSLP